MSHKALVKKALTELFVKGDLTALDRYWSDHYIQHNPMIGNGHDALKGLVTSLGPDAKAEFGLMIEDGEFVRSTAATPASARSRLSPSTSSASRTANSPNTGTCCRKKCPQR